MNASDLVALMCAAPFVLSFAAVLIAVLTAPKGRETAQGFEPESDKK